MTAAPKPPSYEARDVRKDGARRGSVTHTREGHIPVCGRCRARLAPRATPSEAVDALLDHWADARHEAVA